MSFSAAALLLLPTLSQAEAAPSKTMMGPLPTRQVERALVLPKGWVQVTLEARAKWSEGWRDEAGTFQAYGDDTQWFHSQYSLRIEQGFSSHWMPYLDIPYVVSSLRLSDDTITTASLGDAHTGLVWQPVLDRPWRLGLQVDMKAPTGLEWPGDFIGGAFNTSSFLTGTGTTNLGVFARGRVGNSLVALDARVGYILKFPGIVGYVVEPDGFGNGWIDPGDALLVEGGALLQLGDALLVRAEGSYSARGDYRVGTSGESVWSVAWQPLADGGRFLDARVEASYEFSPRCGVVIGASKDLLGSDTRSFAHLGLEEFSPQPGLSADLGLVARW